MMVTESCVISSFAGKGQKKDALESVPVVPMPYGTGGMKRSLSLLTSIAVTISSTAVTWIWRRIIKTCAALASPPSASKAAAAIPSGSASKSAVTAASAWDGNDALGEGRPDGDAGPFLPRNFIIIGVV